MVSPFVMASVSRKSKIGNEVPVRTLHCLPVQVVILAVSIVGKVGVSPLTICTVPVIQLAAVVIIPKIKKLIWI